MTKPMTKAKFTKLMKTLGEDPVDCSMAFDIAEDILADETGLKEYIEQKIGASDYVGWLANQI